MGGLGGGASGNGSRLALVEEEDESSSSKINTASNELNSSDTGMVGDSSSNGSTPQHPSAGSHVATAVPGGFPGNTIMSPRERSDSGNHATSRKVRETSVDGIVRETFANQAPHHGSNGAAPPAVGVAVGAGDAGSGAGGAGARMGRMTAWGGDGAASGDGGADGVTTSSRRLSMAKIDLEMHPHRSSSSSRRKKKKKAQHGALGSRSESRDRRPRADNKIRIAPTFSHAGSSSIGQGSTAGGTSAHEGFLNRGASYFGVAAGSTAGVARAQEANDMLLSYEAVELLTGRDTHLGGSHPSTRNVVLSPMFLVRTWAGPHADLLQSAKFLRRMERYLGIKGIVLVRLEPHDDDDGGRGGGGSVAMMDPVQQVVAGPLNG